jgi:hypothetical protein
MKDSERDRRSVYSAMPGPCHADEEHQGGDRVQLLEQVLHEEMFQGPHPRQPNEREHPMKIESVVLPNALVMAADLRWPDRTWSEVLAHGLALALAETVTPVTSTLLPEDAA